MDRRQRRIRNVSRVMKFGARTVALLLAGLYAVAVALPEMTEGGTSMLGALPPIPLSPVDRLVVLAIGAVPLGLVLIAILSTARLFSLFEAGVPVSAEAGRLLGRIGFFLVLSQLAQVIASAAAGAFVTWRAGDGVLTIAISSAGVVTLLFGGLLLVLGWVMAELADIVEDHRQIV